MAVPYNSQQTTLDYIVEQQLPLILVTSAKLGSINHTLLSLIVCQQHKIEMEAVIYNTYPLEDEKIAKSTQLYLQQYIKQHFPNTEFLVMDRQ